MMNQYYILVGTELNIRGHVMQTYAQIEEPVAKVILEAGFEFYWIENSCYILR